MWWQSMLVLWGKIDSLLPGDLVFLCFWPAIAFDGRRINLTISTSFCASRHSIKSRKTLIAPLMGKCRRYLCLDYLSVKMILTPWLTVVKLSICFLLGTARHFCFYFICNKVVQFMETPLDILAMLLNPSFYLCAK